MVRRPPSFLSPGFTLIEVLVVSLIVGLLTAVGLPMYTKSVETSKADDALSTVQQIATTNRMFALDNPSCESGQGCYAAGQFSTNDACLSASCLSSSCSGQSGSDGANCQNVCNLMACKYMASQTFQNKSYVFYACDPNTGISAGGCCSSGATACAVRASPSQSTNNGTTSDPYLGWGYSVDSNGKATATCTSGSCSSMPPTPSS